MSKATIHTGDVLAHLPTVPRATFDDVLCDPAERDAGLDGSHPIGPPPGSKRSNPAPGRQSALGSHRRNHHPCVKPLALCEYLARLILPPERDTPRRLLVPFAGSGSEAIGALRAGWDAVDGIELDAAHADVARARIAHEQKAAGPLFAETTV